MSLFFYSRDKETKNQIKTGNFTRIVYYYC